MDETTMCLAQRAVACSAWRRMRGMVGQNGDGVPFTLITDDSVAGADWMPDLSHPATLGCLLTLVREAWSRPAAYVAFDHEDDEWLCFVGPVEWLTGATEAEALVAALESAVQP